MKKRFLIVPIVFVLFIVGGAVFFMQKNAKPKTITFDDPLTDLGFQYPEKGLKKAALSETDAKDRISLRLIEEAGAPLLVTVRSETGLKKAASLTRQTILDLVKNNSESLLPARFPEYEKIGEQYLEISGKRSVFIDFTYKNADTKLRQQLYIIPLDDDSAVYVTFQSKESDWVNTSQKFFDPINRSLNISPKSVKT